MATAAAWSRFSTPSFSSRCDTWCFTVLGLRKSLWPISALSHPRARSAKLRRIRRDEYPELYRLWHENRDVRLMCSWRALPPRKAAALGVRPLGMKAQP